MTNKKKHIHLEEAPLDVWQLWDHNAQAYLWFGKPVVRTLDQWSCAAIRMLAEAIRRVA